MVFLLPYLPANGEEFTLIDIPNSGGSIFIDGITFYG
jgi:hypothetical protein